MNQLEQEIVGMISAAGDSKAKAGTRTACPGEKDRSGGTQNPDKAHHCRNE